MRRLIISLSRDFGKTLLVCSHLLSEMEQIATRMLIIDRGSKVVEGDMKDLLDPEHVALEITTTDPPACMQWLSDSSWAHTIQPGNDKYPVVKILRNDIPLLNREMVMAGINILSLKPKNTLEEYFLTLTNPVKNVESY